MKQVLLKYGVAALFLLLAGGLFAQFQEIGIVGDITIVPNPMDKYCTVSVYLNQEANLGVNIEDSRGNVIKTLYWGPANKMVQFSWNRISDTGETVPKGTYYVVVNYSGRYTSIKKTLILK